MTLEECEMFQAALSRQQPLDGVEVAGDDRGGRIEGDAVGRHKVIAILKLGQTCPAIR